MQLTKWVSWQTLIVAAVSFLLAYGSQVYAFAGWQTGINSRLTTSEAVLSEFQKIINVDHDNITAMNERTKAMSDRLDRIGDSIRDLRNAPKPK